LKRGVAAQTDSVFVSALVAAVTPTASAGTTQANQITDLKALIAGLTVTQASKIFFIVTPTIARSLAVNMGADGNRLYPGATLVGGTLYGAPVLMSDQLASGMMLAVDATGVFADPGNLTLENATQTSLQMETAPDSPPTTSTTRINLWQENKVATKAERVFAFTIGRTSAVSALSGIAW
jgi:hypothetical protein